MNNENDTTHRHMGDFSMKNRIKHLICYLDIIVNHSVQSF